MRTFLLWTAALIGSMALIGHSLPSPPKTGKAIAHESSTHTANSGAGAGAEELNATPSEARAAYLTYEVLSDRRFHYHPKPLDAAMSAHIFQRYLEAMDPEKMFFTQRDIERFGAYRLTLGEAIKSKHLEPAFDIFATYQERVHERSVYALSLLSQEFDFSSHERWSYDRAKVAFEPGKSELDALWQKAIKNDVLRLKLAGQKLADIKATLKQRYMRLDQQTQHISKDAIFQTFLDSYARSLDPHTDYLTPRSTDNFNIAMSLSLEGIGATMQTQEDTAVVGKLVPGGPAERAGTLKVGDRIVGVGQNASGPMENVIGWDLEDIVAKIRGKENTKVRLSILDGRAGPDAAATTITLVRQKIRLEEQAAKARVIDLGAGSGNALLPAAHRRIGVITLPSFYEDFEGRQTNDPHYASAARDVAKLLNQLKLQRVDGVVMDLRDNGGGSLTEATAMTGLFIGSGAVVQVRNSTGKVDIERAGPQGAAWSGPLAVLVDRGSASASEIFAAAIQDYRRGLIIGENTFGKGTVQQMVDLDRLAKIEDIGDGGDGPTDEHYGQLKMTNAEFFRVNGRSTQIKGVHPDIEFPVSLYGGDFGETTYDNALPYTEIAAVSGAASASNGGALINQTVELVKMHEKRVKNDKEYQWWLQDYATLKARAEQKSLSLNYTGRVAERDRESALQARRKAERLRLGSVSQDEGRPDDGLQDGERNVVLEAKREKENQERPSAVQREAAAILEDDIGLRKGGEALKAPPANAGK
jgi:carboxyl-terminal processing protease